MKVLMLSVLFIAFSLQGETRDKTIYSIGNTLTDDEKYQIVDCFIGIGSSTEWLKELFLYRGGMDCLKTSAGLAGGGFYDLNALKVLSGLPVNAKENYFPRYTWQAQLYVNPELINWVGYNILSIEKGSLLFELASKVYDKNKYLIRSFVYSYQYITEYSDYDDEVRMYNDFTLKKNADALQYLQRFSPDYRQDYDVDTYEYVSINTQSGYEDNINRFRFGIGFWLRRGIDGSHETIRNMLSQILSVYDEEWYRLHEI